MFPTIDMLNSMIGWLNTNSGAVQAIAILVLVVVTVVYASHTHSIAKENRKLVEEVEKQRFDLWEPWIQPNVIYPANQDMVVTCYNDGKGDAYHVEPIIIHDMDAGYCREAWNKGVHLVNETSRTTREPWPHIPCGTGGPGAEWRLQLPKADSKHVAAVLYKDRFGRQFISGYGFRIEEGKVIATEVIPPQLFKEAKL
ncbi:MAG: hypothetical protein HYX82_06090 [Chloroflexi bacterium]|nr:hypothetical protein [Chloroflexota bacterium]